MRPHGTSPCAPDFPNSGLAEATKPQGGHGSPGAENLPLGPPHAPSRLPSPEATPSFCSSACYLLLLKSLQLWDAAQPQPVISERAWLALIPRLGQHDGEGPWGWANANGPGLAVLVHRLGAGVNFEDWRKARPGDFMKIFWTDHIGRRESGHLTVLVKDGGDTVTFWSSNMPDGYGAKTVPKSQIRRVIFTRITRPERFNLAPAVGSHPWLSSLLRQEVGIKEVRRYSGMQNP